MSIRKTFLTGIAVTVSIVICFAFAYSKQENPYKIRQENEREIQYPQISYTDEKNEKKEEKINALILNHLYGPYSFLADSELASTIDYKITYHDEDYLSICYSGEYVDKSGYAGSVCYAITIDLNDEKIVDLKDIVGDEGKNEILRMLKNRTFKTEYGAITSDNKYIDINSVIEEQPIANVHSAFCQYYYFLREKGMGIIITGLPRYGGNYSRVCVEYLWKM